MSVRSGQHSKSSVSAPATDTTAVGSEQLDEVRPLTGQFGGIVHNQTVNVSAEVGILVRDDDGILSGCMGVAAPLFGSGPLTGVVVGDDVSFSVTSSIGTITFTGHRSESSITGTYSVEHENRPGEEGSFTLEKAKKPGGLRKDFDTANCPTDAEIHK